MVIDIIGYINESLLIWFLSLNIQGSLKHWPLNDPFEQF